MSMTMRSKQPRSHINHFTHRFSSLRQMDMGSCIYLSEGACVVQIESYCHHIKCHVHFFARSLRVAAQTVCEDVCGYDKNVMLLSKLCGKVCGTIIMLYKKCIPYM